MWSADVVDSGWDRPPEVASSVVSDTATVIWTLTLAWPRGVEMKLGWASAVVAALLAASLTESENAVLTATEQRKNATDLATPIFFPPPADLETD